MDHVNDSRYHNALPAVKRTQYNYLYLKNQFTARWGGPREDWSIFHGVFPRTKGTKICFLLRHIYTLGKA